MSLSLLALAGHATAGVEESIRAGLAKQIPGEKIESIKPTRRGGLFEVVTNDGIVYTDRTGSFLLLNAEIVDTTTGVNFTRQRLNNLTKFSFKDLPLKDAIKTVIGNGSRSVVTFEDPNCGFCKKLAPELQRLKDVTIYTYIVPILSPKSREQAVQVLCSDDPSAAWNLFMKSGVLKRQAECNNALDRNAELYRKLHLNGTPTLLFESNTVVPGYLTADNIELKLASIKQKE